MLCDQLSRFPDHLPDIIRSGGAGQELDELLAALGGEDEPDKDQMLAWLNDIEDACASEGLAGVTSREHAFRPLPPGYETSGPQAWVCPRGRCDRVVLTVFLLPDWQSGWPPEWRPGRPHGPARTVRRPGAGPPATISALLPAAGQA
jgi:hypothetical protein